MTFFSNERSFCSRNLELIHYPNFNNKEFGGSRSNYKILQPGADEDINGVNGSMYLVKDQTEGIILFEHFFYGGERKVMH